jgi:hypothetical protein
MQKNILFLSVVALVLGIVCVSAAFAAMADANNVKEAHEGVTVGCTVCHPEGNFKEVNSYGKAYNEAGRSVDAVKAIDAVDSDADGVVNVDEIKAGTNPGDATSK